MADQKVSALTSLTVISGEDVLLIIDDPSGSPVSKKVALIDLLAALPANTSITGTLTVSGNTVVSTNHITIAATSLVASNNTTTHLAAGKQGSIFWDADFLYVAISNTVIKRTALSIWDS